MPTPSLLIVPARFKTGKLYSQIPTSGAGDFTVTRNTTATRLNSAGVIESVASGIPRLDYLTSGGTAGCPALLVEPSAQNFFWPSDDFANGISTPSAFGLNDFGSGSVSNTSATLDPFGTNLADYIQENSASGIQHRALFSARPGMVSGTTYTASVFAKAAQRTRFRLYNNGGGGGDVSFDLSNGTITAQSGIPAGASPRIENYGNGWFRCSLPYTPSVSALFNVIGGLLDASGNAVYNGTGTQGLYIFGLQIEVGSVPTSYIPTTTGSVTRNADLISVTGAVSGSIGQTEGTIYVEFEHTSNTAERRVISLSDGTATNRIFIWAMSNILYAQIQGGSITIVNPIPSGYNKIAFAYQQNGVSGNLFASINGGAVVSGTSTTYPATINRVAIGSSENAAAGVFQWNNRIRAVALYTTRLTNAELATLTTP